MSSQPISQAVAVNAGGGGGGGGGSAKVVAAQPVKAAGGSAAADDKGKAAKKAIKPIAADCEGNCRTYETKIQLVTPTDTGSEIKLGSCESAGAKVGDVGEIYVKGAVVEGARFKITKVLKSSCRAVTNAPSDAIKDSDKVVIKIPEG